MASDPEDYDANPLVEALIALFEAEVHPAAREAASQARRKLPLAPLRQAPGEPLPPLSIESALDNPNRHPVTALVPRELDRLPWTEGPYKRPPFLEGRNMFVRLIHLPLESGRESIRMGLYYQAPNSDYPDHSHSAEEVYIPLSGLARWRKGSGDWLEVAPGTLIHHASFEAHATVTGEQPLLAAWAWIGEIDPGNFRFDNPYWAA